MLDQAIKDGVVDQSYAYFLAAHANSLRCWQQPEDGQTSWGMQLARWGCPVPDDGEGEPDSPLVVFYKLERKAGSDVKMAPPERAVEKTNLFQNRMNRANRPELFRGKEGSADDVHELVYSSWAGSRRAGMMGGQCSGETVGAEYGRHERYDDSEDLAGASVVGGIDGSAVWTQSDGCGPVARAETGWGTWRRNAGTHDASGDRRELCHAWAVA